MIPKVINFVWIGGCIPSWGRRIIELWRELNPRYSIYIHGEEVLDERLRGAYESRKKIASKSDILRVCALRNFGGYYVDVDLVPLRPIDRIEAEHPYEYGTTSIIGEVRGGVLTNANNCFLRATPRCQSLESLVSEILITTWDERLNNQSYGPNIVMRCAQRESSKFDILDHWLFYGSDLGFDRNGDAVDILVNQNKALPQMGKAYAFHLWHGCLSDSDIKVLKTVKPLFGSFYAPA
jgi:hypothetical protein